ncbi:MAG: metal-dependent hydrolase [Thermoplasmata archaeon]
MFPLGHFGLTVALGEMLSRGPSRPVKLDYRILLLGSMFADLVDKPVGILFGIEGRNVAHSLLFSVSLTVFLLLPLLAPQLYPRGIAQRLSNPLPLLSLGLWTHLLLDRIWEQPYVVLWPFLGAAFHPAEFNFLLVLTAVLNPYVLGGEIAGLAILLFMAHKYRLYRWSNLLRAIKTGVLRY